MVTYAANYHFIKSIEAEVLDSLIKKYLEGTASREEINQIEEWYQSFDAKPDLFEAESEEGLLVMEKSLTGLRSKLGFE